MSSYLPPRSEQSIGAEPHRPRGAVWIIAALYVFCAVVFASWAGGWGENNTQAATPPAPQHSLHGAHG